MSKSNPSKSEKAIQAEILKYVQSLPNCWAAKFPAAWMRGTPDLLVCYRGQFVAFEVKTLTGRATPLQQIVIERIEAAGGRAYVVHNVQEVQGVLMQIDQRERSL